MPIAKAFKNILEAAFIWKKRLGKPQAPEEEFIYEGLLPGVDIPKHWSCMMLDLADRAAMLLGEPAKQFYHKTAQWAEYLWASVYYDECKPIYKERYMDRVIAEWQKEDRHIDETLGSHNPDPAGFNPGPIPLQTETIEVP